VEAPDKGTDRVWCGEARSSEVRYGDLDAGGIGRYGLMNKLAF
jgi:hypothetical protein